MAEIYTVRSILGDESLQNLINQGKSQDEIISIAKAYKDEAIKSGDKDALNRMNLVSQKQGRADFFTRLGDKMDANGYETMGSIARGIDILASKAAAPIASLVGDSDKEAQILADMKLTQSINEAKNLDKIATTPRTQREYQIDSNNLLANAIGSYTKDSKTYARNLMQQAENSGYTAMDRFNIGMATTANATKYFIKSLIYGEDSKEANDIKDAQKILQASRDAYEANNPDKWNIANFAGEMVTDPLNAVGLAKGFKVANTAFKKGANVAFDLAQLGAIGGMAGAISEYGSYKDKDEQNVAGAAMMGATSGVALGAGFMALGAVLNKIASRFGQKSALEQNAQMAKDETTKELEKGTPQDIDKRLQKISDDIEEAFSADENAENIARLLGQEYDDNINKAIKQSEEATTAIDSSVAKFANDNPNSSASDIEIYINKTYAPSQSEKELTRIINDDKPVTPRMAGYRVLGVLQKTMEYKTRFDRDTIIKRFKNHGFNDELANVFADAYTADDISVARNYLDAKVASNRQKSVEDGRNEWLENTTKDNQAKTPKNQDEILKEISSDKTQFKLIDDSDMTPELKSRLENDGYTLEREPESGVWEVSKGIPNQDLKSTDVANVSDEIGINSTKGNFKYLIKDTFSFPNLRDMLKNKLSFILKKDITNKETGLTGIITEAERNKISSSKAVNKSIKNGFSKEEHFKVAEDIKNIFENASLIQKHNDYKNRRNILAVYRFSKSVNINNKEANAKITLLEKIEGKNKIYTIELDSLDKSNPLSTPYSDAGLAVKAQDTRDGVRPNASIAKTDEKTIPNESIKEAENLTLLSRDMQSGDPKTGNLDNTAIIHTDEEPPRPRTSSPYNANSKTIPNQDLKSADEALQNAVVKADKLDILDKSKPFRKAEKSELTDQLMEEVIKNDSKLWIDNASDEVSKLVGLPNAKITLNGSAIKHTLQRHGENSVNVKNGEPPITLDDIKNHADIVNNADKRTFGVSDDGQKVLISAKQINGHFVVVETIGTKKRQLSFKTMYKVNGKLENNPLFKDSTASAKQIETAESSLSPKPSANLDSLSRANTKNSTPKEIKSQGGKILYQSPNANSISQTLLQTSQYSANKIDVAPVSTPKNDLDRTLSNRYDSSNSTPKEIKSQELNLSRAERRAMGIEEPKGKTLVIDEKAVKSDVREFGRLADQVGLGFKSAKEAKAVMDKCDKSKFDCGS